MPSLQDRIRQRQASEFVGRDDQLAAFRRNFALPLDERIYVFNVFGQGGVGKSTLLRRFRELALASGATPALTDDDQTDVLTAMDALATDLGRQGHTLRTFTERYQTYRKLRQELESEPDAPPGLSSLFARTLVKGGLALARGVPVGGGLVDLVDGDVVASKTGEWVEYVARKLHNNTDEIQLVREPIQELTRLWISDLNKLAVKSPVVLFFDTYERTAPFLDEWLRDVLSGAYGPVPDTTQFVVAGRDELDRNLWAEYESVIARLSLGPFTEDEARDFLKRKGVTDEQVVTVILHLSGCLPLLVATLAVERPDDPSKVGDPSGTAVERFLVWTEDPVLRRAAVDAALPRAFNRDIVALLADKKQVDRVFEWLKRMPFVQERADGWAYHAVARELMLRYKRRESQQSWAALHGHLATHYEQAAARLHLGGKDRWRDGVWRALTLEALYHRSCQSPQVHLATALNAFLESRDATTLDETEQFIEPIAAGAAHTDEPLLHTWANRLRRLCAVAREGASNETVEQWDTLLRYPQLTARNQAIAHTYKGVALREIGLYDDAIEAFSRAVTCDPEYAWALASRGSLYRTLTRYRDALADLDRALAIRPIFVMPLIERASVYRALADYEAALVDLSAALQIHPTSAAALIRRGATYRVLGRYTDALADISLALERKPDDGWFLYQRALVYLLQGDHTRGMADLAAAIPLARREYEQHPENWYNAFSIVIYQLAAHDVVEARRFYAQLLPQAPWYGLRAADVAFADYRISFPDNAEAHALRTELQLEIDRREAADQAFSNKR